MRRTEYKYQVGEVVNETLRIVEQIRYGSENRKAYVVQSLTYPDAPNYKVLQGDLKKGVGDAYVSGRRTYYGNSLWSIKELRSCLIKKEALNVSMNSGKKISVNCFKCKYKNQRRVADIRRYGFRCPICSNVGLSYPERYFMAYLEIKKIDYTHQKTFEGLPNRRFDFYIENLGVIETHGLQHYQDTKGFISFENTIFSDELKRNFLRKNNINLIEIDCRESSFDFIKNSINSCDLLPNIVKEDEKKILKHMIKNDQNNIEEMTKLYNDGFNAIQLSDMFDKPVGTIYNILKRNGVVFRVSDTSIKVRCISLDIIFNSMIEASEYMGFKNSSPISNHLKGRTKSAGKHPITGERLTWEYVDIE